MKKLLYISLIVINLSCYASLVTDGNESLANQIQEIMKDSFVSADDWAVRVKASAKADKALQVINQALDAMGKKLGVTPKAMQLMKDSTAKIVQNRADTKGRISKSDVQAVVKSVKYALVTPIQAAISADAIAVGASAGTVGATIGKTTRKVKTLYTYSSAIDNESKLTEAALFLPRVFNIIIVGGLLGVYDTIILAGQGGIVGAKTADQIIIERITGGTNVVDSVESAVKDINAFIKSSLSKQPVLIIDGASSEQSVDPLSFENQTKSLTEVGDVLLVDRPLTISTSGIPASEEEVGAKWFKEEESQELGDHGFKAYDDDEEEVQQKEKEEIAV